MKLQRKFLLALLPAGALAAALALVLIRRSVHSVLFDAFEREAVAAARAAAAGIAQAPSPSDEMRLLPLLQELQKRQDGFYAALLDSRGRILAHTTVTETGREAPDELPSRALLWDEPVSAVTAVRGQSALLVAVPVWKARPPGPDSAEDFLLSGRAATPRSRLGTVVLAAPMAQALETEARLIRDVTLVALFVGGLVLALVVALVGGILRPVRSLTAGIARVKSGEYDLDVPVLTRDELGELAASFNSMSRELSRTMVSKEYVEGILENIADLLFVTDPQGRVQTVNQAAAATLERRPEELVGRHFWELFDDPPAELRPPAFEAAVLTGRVRDVEAVLAAAGGRRVHALISVSVFKHGDGALRAFIFAGKDITERKHADAALLEAKEAAERSNRELETFSYSVAHDLRAPLRVIGGLGQMVLSSHAQGLDAKGKELLERMLEGTQRMNRLIGDLLDLAHITRSSLDSEMVDLSALADELANELRQSQPERRARFVIERGLRAVGDADLLRLALSNLLANSWKYTSRHPAARIEFGATGPETERVYFVRDDGAGFDMAFADKLFRPFSRLHGPSEFEGTGIGLATVQRIVERHGGRVWAEGAVERGAAVYFTLGKGLSRSLSPS